MPGKGSWKMFSYGLSNSLVLSRWTTGWNVHAASSARNSKAC